MVEFDCEDVTLLSDVVVEVTTNTGALFELSAVYDEGAGGFVASGDITNGLPENVAVRYAYGGALVFSPEHVKQLQAKQQEAPAAAPMPDLPPMAAEPTYAAAPINEVDDLPF